MYDISTWVINSFLIATMLKLPVKKEMELFWVAGAPVKQWQFREVMRPGSIFNLNVSLEQNYWYHWWKLKKSILHSSFYHFLKKIWVTISVLGLIFFMSKQSRFGFKNEALKMDFWDSGQNKDIWNQYILRDARLLFHYKFCCLLHDNAFEAHFH